MRRGELVAQLQLGAPERNDLQQVVGDLVNEDYTTKFLSKSPSGAVKSKTIHLLWRYGV